MLQIIYIQSQHNNFMFKCVVFITITANRTNQGYYNQVNRPKLIILVKQNNCTRHFMTEHRVNVKATLKIKNIFFSDREYLFSTRNILFATFYQNTNKTTQRHLFHLLTSYLRHNYSQIIQNCICYKRT